MDTITFLTIYEPESPIQREARFAGPISELLEKSGAGYVIGGGTKFYPSGEFEFCYLEVHTPDLNRTRAFLKSFFVGSNEFIRWEI